MGRDAVSNRARRARTIAPIGWGFAIGGLCTLVAAADVRAGEPAEDDRPKERARLSYTLGPGVTGCPEATAMRRAVAERLGYDPFDDKDAAARVELAVTRARGELVADVERFDETGKSLGSRRIDSAGSSCHDLASAAALAISIAIDPTAALMPARPIPEPKAPASASAEEQAPKAPAKQPAKKPSTKKPALATKPPASALTEEDKKPVEGKRPIRFRVGAGALGSLATAPSPNLGFVAHVDLRGHMWSAGIEGRADVPSSGQAPDEGTVSAYLLAARAAPCAHFDPVFVCALATFGALSGASEDVPNPARDTTFYSSAGLAGGAEYWPADYIGLRGQVELEATITRTTLRVSGQDAWTTPPIHGALTAMLLLSIP